MKICVWIYLMFISVAAVGQTFSLSGQVEDEKGLSLPWAEITLSGKDGVSLAATVDTAGKFSMRLINPGQYYLLIRAMGYESYEDTVQITGEDVAIGKVRLSVTSQMLDEFKAVSKAIPVVQKDDTVEFNSRSYKVNPDAAALDIVRKMPLFDLNGQNITAQGENVVKVMVDGKQFFGSDPYAALQNLPAEIIDKVQVYNEKSDQEQFTGFSEGATSKTINIITKSSKRDGTMGSIYGGGGGDDGADRYSTGCSLSDFEGDRRMTLTGQANNVNVQNFTDPGNDGSSGGNAGLTKTNAIGGNYSDKWGSKAEISGSYFFNETGSDLLTQSHRAFVQPADSGEVYNQVSSSASQNYSHRFNARFSYAIDSANSILWQPALYSTKTKSNMQLVGNSEDGSGPMSQSVNNAVTDHTGLNFSSSLLYKHKFPKKGRTLSFDINTNSNSNDGSTLHDFQNLYYSSPALSDTFNQQSLQHQNTWNVTGNAVYTEPAGARGLLKLEYDLSYLPTRSQNNTYDYSYITDSYSRPDSEYSNSFFGATTIQKAGCSYQMHQGKCEFSLGASYQFSRLTDEQAEPVAYSFDRNYQNILPVAMLRYKFSKSSNLQVNYSTTTQNPSVNELQNVVNNTNPLFLTVGNPDLVQPYRHTLSVKYNSLNKQSLNNFSASVAGNYTQHNISTSTIIAGQDTVLAAEHLVLPKGSQLTMPINMDGGGMLNVYIGYGMPLKALKCNVKFSIAGNISRVPALINGIENDHNIKNGTFGISISSNISENVDFILSTSASIISNSNSLNPQLNTTYMNGGIKASINLIFWKTLIFNTNVVSQINSGLSAGYNQDYFIWNMSVGRKMFKKKQGDLRLLVNNLLNENSDIQHAESDVYVQDTRTNMLQRYFLLVFTYKIRNFKNDIHKVVN